MPISRFQSSNQWCMAICFIGFLHFVFECPFSSNQIAKMWFCTTPSKNDLDKAPSCWPAGSRTYKRWNWLLFTLFRALLLHLLFCQDLPIFLRFPPIDVVVVLLVLLVVHLEATDVRKSGRMRKTLDDKFAKHVPVNWPDWPKDDISVSIPELTKIRGRFCFNPPPPLETKILAVQGVHWSDATLAS